MRRTTCNLIAMERNQPVNISCMLCSAKGDDAPAESPTVREAIHYLLTRETGLHTSNMADARVNSYYSSNFTKDHLEPCRVQDLLPVFFLS